MDSEMLKICIDDEFANGECIVAFLDILGFKEHVKKYVSPEYPQDKEILEKIKSALDDAFKIITQSEYRNLLRIKVFSDCTCASMPGLLCTPTEASMLCSLITWVAGYNFQLIRRSIYPRGGISAGFHYEDENMIFSDGLIKAHELENEIAIYPRTILDKELVQRLKWLWMDQRETIELFGTNKKIIVDEEETAFINPFNLIQSTDKGTYEDLKKQFNNEKDFRAHVLSIDHDYNMKVLKNLEDEIKKRKEILENLREKFDNKKACEEYLLKSGYKLNNEVLGEDKEKVEEYKINERILDKYLWLKDLLKWNMDPKSSERNFEYLLKY
jgi:hypothetical protein